MFSEPLSARRKLQEFPPKCIRHFCPWLVRFWTKFSWKRFAVCLEFRLCVHGGAGRILSRLNCHIHIQPNLHAEKCICPKWFSYLLKYLDVFVRIPNLICSNWRWICANNKMCVAQMTKLSWQHHLSTCPNCFLYLSKYLDVFVWIPNLICSKLEMILCK